MLDLSGITGGYGETTVLRDVSLAVPDGAVVALLGPNGAGKTTLLRVASGIIRPAFGRVTLDGEDVTDLGPTARSTRGLCHIPEGRGIFPTLTVRENLVLFSPRGTEKDSLEKATLAFPILGSRMKQLAGTMSGGQQQMLAIVRAYISRAKLVLIDEASLGLAPVVVDSLFEFMGQLGHEGVSLLLVEQYVNRALALAQTVYVLNRGQIALSGPASELEGDELFEQYSSIAVTPTDG